MIHYVLHDSTGKILQVGSCTAAELQLYEAATGLTALTGSGDFAADYVAGGLITPRPQMSLSYPATPVQADGVASFPISGVPAGATLVSDECSGVADGSLIAFVTDNPGEHRLRVTLWPYRDEEIVINAL